MPKKKVELGRRLVAQGRWIIKRVAEALDISRPHLSMSSRQPPKVREPYLKEDAPLLARIRKLAEERPSYGYRRVTVLLHRQAGYEQVNHKWVYRVMKQAQMLFPKYASRPNRNHTGTILTFKSNLRRFSDGLEI